MVVGARPNPGVSLQAKARTTSKLLFSLLRSEAVPARIDGGGGGRLA